MNEQKQKEILSKIKVSAEFEDMNAKYGNSGVCVTYRGRKKRYPYYDYNSKTSVTNR